MVNYDHLLQAVISKQFLALTRGWHHWIRLEEICSIRNDEDLAFLLSFYGFYGFYGHLLQAVISKRFCTETQIPPLNRACLEASFSQNFLKNCVRN